MKSVLQLPINFFKMNNKTKFFLIAAFLLINAIDALSQSKQTPSTSDVKTMMGQYAMSNGAYGPQNVLITFDYEFFREYLSSGYFLGVRIKNISYEYLGGAGGKRFKTNGKIYTADELQSYDFRGQDCFNELNIVDATIVNLKVAGFGKDFVVESQLHTIYGLGKIADTKDLNTFSLTNVGASLRSVTAKNTDCLLERIRNFEKSIKSRGDYKSAIQKADQAFQAKDWSSAKQYYKQASGIFPEENYPTTQLERIKEEEDKITAAKNKALNDVKTAGGATTTGGTKTSGDTKSTSDANQKKAGDATGSEKSNKEAKSEEDIKKEKESLGKKGSGLSPQQEREIAAEKRAADEKIEAERKAEAARLEAERIAREEKARVERKDNWEKQKQAETDANFDLLEDLGVAALLLHISIAQLTYADIGMSGPGNIYPDPSLCFDMEFGYGLTIAPLYVDVREEKYDGNVTTYDESAKYSNIFNLDYQFKTSFWPVQNKNFGLAFSGGVSGGHGFTFESYNYQLQYGTKAYIGSETFKFYTEYNLVNRTFIVSSWLDSKVSEEGTSSGTIHQLKAGMRFNFDTYWETDTRASIDILPVFELDQRSSFKNGYGRLPESWTNGLEVGLSFDNRLHAYFRTMWNFPIFGENKYALGPSVDKTDIFLNFGVVRNLNFIMNNEVTGTVSNLNTLRRMAKEQRNHTLYFLMPSYQYFKTMDGQFNYQPAISITPIGYSYEYFPVKNFSIGLSGLLTYQIIKMGIDPLSKNIPSGMKIEEAYKMENINIEAPLSIKYHNTFQSNNNYWLMAAYNNIFAVSQSVTAFSLLDNKEITKNSVEMNTSLSSFQYGIGCDFNIGDSYFSAGLIYEKGRGNLIEGADGTKINGIRFLVGAKL